MDTRSANLIGQHDVATVRSDALSSEAAEKMSDAGVGSLIVLHPESGAPIGILTDRDLAVRVVAHSDDPGSVPVSDAMTSPLVSVEAEEPAEVVVELMKRHGIRRIPVMEAGALVGIVALDDLFQSLAAEMDDLGQETQS